MFRNLKKADGRGGRAVLNVKAKEVIFVPPYEGYVEQFNAAVGELRKLTPMVKSVKKLKDEAAELKCVKTVRELMQLKNILESFAEFDDNDLTLPAQRLPTTAALIWTATTR